MRRGVVAALRRAEGRGGRRDPRRRGGWGVAFIPGTRGRTRTIGVGDLVTSHGPGGGVGEEPAGLATRHARCAGHSPRDGFGNPTHTHTCHTLGFASESHCGALHTTNPPGGGGEGPADGGGGVGGAIPTSHLAGGGVSQEVAGRRGSPPEVRHPRHIFQRMVGFIYEHRGTCAWGRGCRRGTWSPRTACPLRSGGTSGSGTSCGGGGGIGGGRRGSFIGGGG